VINRSHRSLARACLVLALAAVAGCDAATEEPTPTPSEAPSIRASVEPSVEPSEAPSASAEQLETSVVDLEVGDCFSVERDELTSVLVVACDATHEYEVFAVLEHDAGPDAPYPGEPELVEHADAACQPSFEAFVGRDYQTSTWYITSLPPSESTWADGDREIVCTLNQLDDTQEPIAVTGSAEGSGE
jgi:Septum formation